MKLLFTLAVCALSFCSFAANQYVGTFFGNAEPLTNVNLRPWNPDDIYGNRARRAKSILYQQKVLNLAYIGDTGSSFGGLWYETIYGSLNPFLDRQGFGIQETGPSTLYAYGTLSGLSSVITGTDSTPWPGSVYGLGNAATFTWASGIVTLGYPANNIGLIWLSQPGFGTLALQTNSANGTFATCLTASGVGTAGSGFGTNFPIPRLPNYGWRVVSTGTNQVVGVVLWDSTGPGYRVTQVVQGNIDVFSRWASIDTNLFYRAWSLINPDAVLFESNDSAASVTNSIAALDARWVAACPNAEVIYLTPNQNLLAANVPAAQGERDAEIYYGKVYNRQIYDANPYFFPTNDWVTPGYYSDATHLTARGAFMETARLPFFIGIDPASMVELGYTYKARAMSFVNSTETNYLGAGTATPAARFDVLDANFNSSSHFSFSTIPNLANYPALWLDLGGVVKDFPTCMVFNDTGTHGYVWYYSPSNSTSGWTGRKAEDWNPGGFPTRDRWRFWPNGGLELITSGYAATDPGVGNLFFLQGFGGGLSRLDSLIVTNGMYANLTSSTNLGGTFLQTNWISGQVYTNDQKADVWVQCSVSMVTASVAGACRVSLQTGVNIAGLAHLSGVGGQTIVGSLAETETNWLGGFVASGNVFTFTNNVTGVGNSALIISGTGQRKTF